MQFFTPDLYEALYDWETLPQALVDLKDANERYAARLTQIRESFSPAVAAASDAWLVNDALIAKLRQSETPSTLELVLRCGDLQVGYFDLDFTYASPDVSDEHLRSLMRVASNIRGSRFYGGWDAWVQEIDRLKDGRIEHRIYFHHGGWIAIRCREFQVVRVERANRRLPPFPIRYRVERFNATSRSKAISRPVPTA